MRRLLEVFANIATVAVASVVIWALLTARTTPIQPAAPQTVSAPPAGYNIGDPGPSIEGLSYTSSKGTLIIVARSGCRYCENSMPFYRRLIEERNKRARAFQIAFVAPANDSAFGAQLLQAAVSPDHVLSFRPGQLKIKGTPTAILVDDRGRVQRTWQGQLRPQQENEVVQVLLRPS